MSRVINISDTTFAKLERIAESAGTSPEQWVSDIVDQSAPADPKPTRAKTLADLLKDRIGNFAGRPGTENLSAQTHGAFVEGLLEKQRKGHL